MRGLVKTSEVRWLGVQQKLSTVAWTQDNISVNYKTNPRVTETNVYDSVGNRRRATIDYGPYAQWGLPYLVKEYAADGVTEIRHTFTDYNLSQQYLDRRIIGLVSNVHVSNAAEWQTRISYGYDDPSRITSQATTATMHDQSYDGLFTVRGNVTSVSKWDVTDIGNASKALPMTVSYNAAGSVLSTTDPAGHTSFVSYGDSFSDGNNSRNTFAYPTTVSDGDGFGTFRQYNFDFGAVTRFEGPPPQNQPNGIIQTFAYDSAARIERVTTQNNGAYTRYVYGPTYVATLGSVNTIADEAYAIHYFDGVGREVATAGNHPGSTGGYKAQLTVYDLMGRVVEQTNPTEITGSWIPSGDDATGWQYNNPAEYDWKGRPLKIYNMDGSYKTASYGGCGCAGGEVVTLTDEVGRQQKVYSDVLGRTWKSEVLNGDGSVYSTGVSVYDARDQVKKARQYAGTAPAAASSTNENAECPTNTCQQTTMNYDGYGRLQSKHVPEQDAGTATTWTYNADNTLNSVTDARGASATYDYNNGRHLVNHISYEPAGGAPDTPDVSFAYDAAGNRTSMTDGLGSQSYNYNQLSQLMSETRTFTNVGTFTLSYDYNLAGELKTISDPWGATLNYGFDSIGRLNNITGSGYGSVSQIASDMHYRAWGTLKSETFGNGFTEAATYNSRLQMTSFEVRKPSSELQMSTTTQFYADGQVKLSHNALDERFDRAFAYDHAARTAEAYSGSEARDFVNNTNSGAPTGPYRQSYQFNQFNQITQQTNRLWSNNQTTTSMYVNNRMQGWFYDAAGFVTAADGTIYTRDAAGRNAQADNEDSHATYGFDGDGRMLKAVRSRPGFNGGTIARTTYYLNSTVMGRLAVAELNASGQKTTRYVYAGSRKLTEETSGTVTWSHQEPVTGSRGNSTSGGGYFPQAEFNADGINVGFQEPVSNGFDNPEPMSDWGLLALGSSCSSADPDCRTCYLDGFEHDCNRINWEASEQCPNNDCGPRNVWNPVTGRPELTPLTTNPNNGQLGYWPNGPSGPGVVFDSFGHSHTVIVSGDGHSQVEMQWVFDEVKGEWVFVPVPTAYEGSDYFKTEPQSSYDPRVDFRDYAESLSKNKQIDDCQKLALMIYKAGRAFGGNAPNSFEGRDIVRGLMSGLTEWTRVALAGREGPSDPNYRVGVFVRDPHYGGGFGDSGFAPHFQDGSNQVRHFTFYFGAGYGIGSTAANVGLRREEGTNDPRVADVGLGWAATDLGSHFNGNYRQLAQDVWHRVCGQSGNLNLP